MTKKNSNIQDCFMEAGKNYEQIRQRSHSICSEQKRRLVVFILLADLSLHVMPTFPQKQFLLKKKII